MIYKEFKGKKLSALGMGCMRLPLAGSADSDIDETAVAEMVAYARENGVNYFDTAWGYHGGCSETVMGKVLSQYPRDSFYLASKFPGFAPENLANAPEIFETQLRKCQVEYFDFYLVHNVSQRNIDGLMDEKYGVFDYLLQQKRNGHIRHLGFSTHGSLEVIKRYLDAYGDELEFCQIQLNYLDWTLQNAKAKVELLKQYHIPVWVMEPVRGGKLAALSEDAMAKLHPLRPDTDAPAWAFRFLQSLEGVTMTLSGMSNMAQLSSNIRTYETEQPLMPKEWDALMEIANDMIRANAIPCTGCSYCVERCPQQIPIPDIMKAYNEHKDGNKPQFSPGAADCIGCRNCEIVCPQCIVISELMAKY